VLRCTALPPHKFTTIPLQSLLDGEKESNMIYYALVFLIVGLVAGALGLFGVAAISSQIAWVLFLVGIVLLVVQLVRGRPPAL
jgi:uncharacterized membrane protein YtjA (UPF0391 family)